MIITISGKPGSGKSTIGKRLAEHFQMPRYYMGGLRRKMAEERGMTLAAFNRLGEQEAFTDKDVDAFATELGKKEKSFVIEGRTAFHFVPKGVHIFLDVEPEEGARRIFGHLKQDPKNTRNEDVGLNSVEDVLRSNKERMESDTRRYAKYYDLDVFDPKHYDIVLDTTHVAPDEVFSRILDLLKDREAKKS
jgi:cytidylate kinase